MSFLHSINNVAISNKIAKSKTVPHNLEQCTTRAVQTEAQYQFAEGANLGRRTGPSPLRSVMVQEIDGNEDNLQKIPFPKIIVQPEMHVGFVVKLVTMQMNVLIM